MMRNATPFLKDAMSYKNVIHDESSWLLEYRVYTTTWVKKKTGPDACGSVDASRMQRSNKWNGNVSPNLNLGNCKNRHRKGLKLHPNTHESASNTINTKKKDSQTAFRFPFGPRSYAFASSSRSTPCTSPGGCCSCVSTGSDCAPFGCCAWGVWRCGCGWVCG
jgi:hypothetical protein